MRVRHGCLARVEGGALFNGQGGTIEGTIVQGAIVERVRTPEQVRLAWDKPIYMSAVASVAEAEEGRAIRASGAVSQALPNIPGMCCGSHSKAPRRRPRPIRTAGHLNLSTVLTVEMCTTSLQNLP